MALREEEEAHLFQVRPANGVMGLDHFRGEMNFGALTPEGPWGDLSVVHGICEGIHGPVKLPIVFIDYKMNDVDTIIYEVIE